MSRRARLGAGARVPFPGGASGPNSREWNDMPARICVRKRAQPLFDCLSASPPGGVVNLYWLGQAGFAIRSYNLTVLIDAYLSNALAATYRDALFKHRRMMAPPLDPDEARGIDFLLSTHAHSDHLDPGSIGKIMALNPECRLVCPRSAVAKALERGADRDRVIAMSSLEKRRLGAMEAEMLPAAHEELAADGAGNILYAGYVLTLDGVTMYHSGDCVPYDGQVDVVKERRPDLAMLPVNGRDEHRAQHGVAGNFTVAEAADLCLAAGIDILIPHHFDMFEFNTVPREEIARVLSGYSARGLKWFVPDVGEYLAASACAADPGEAEAREEERPA